MFGHKIKERVCYTALCRKKVKGIRNCKVVILQTNRGIFVTPLNGGGRGRGGSTINIIGYI